MQHFPHAGAVVWIGLRPQRGAAMLSVQQAHAEPITGLEGDRYQGTSGKREITLIQWEHLAVLSAFVGNTVEPEWLRRNIVVKGINLLALKDQRFCVGGAILQSTGLCHPCSKMETVLGAGGYNAMRGHGGLTAKVLQAGRIQIGDTVSVIGNG